MHQSPQEPENRYLDVAALTLFVSGMIVALCILGYPMPGPGEPVAEEPTHVLGEPGLWLGGELVDALGVAAYAFLASWFVVVVLLYLRKCWLTWTLRFFGWLVLLPTTAILAHEIGPDHIGGPLTGSGGNIGTYLSLWLHDQFEPAGVYLVLGSLIVLGLFTALDFVMLPLLAAGGWLLARLMRRSRRPLVEAEEVTVVAELDEDSTDFVVTPVEPKPAPAPVPAKEKAKPTPVKKPALPSVPISRPRLEPVASTDEDETPYELPPLTLLEDPAPFPYEEHDQSLRERAALLERTFNDFGLNVRVVGIHTGPVVTQYEVALETGLRVNKVTALADDLALNLSAPSVRIVAPIPGKNTVGIEVPNQHRAMVRIKELILATKTQTAKARLPLFLGRDTEGRPLVPDLAEMPHLLVAGTTGTGKSVCLNSLIISLLLTRTPDECKMLMIDPKQVEMTEYSRIPHLMHPVVTDMKKAEAILAWAVDKMEERYDLLRRARVRNIGSYNDLPYDEILKRVQPMDAAEREAVPERMPYIVLFVDELAELMMLMKKEVEGHIIRLAQKSRAAGIHLVLTTQKPTVDVITGLIKSNLPSRIAFKVASRTDSAVVLDEKGAEKLLGKGDMLFLPPGTSSLVRAQGTFVSDPEIAKVVGHLDCEPQFEAELMNLKISAAGAGGMMEHIRKRDDLYEQAIDIVVREGRGSTSLLQRALGIGYGRAARLIDFMAEDGIVGQYNGSQARDVLYTHEQWQQLKNGETSEEVAEV